MKNKKYYSISEVTKILNTTPYQLRYLEQILPQFILGLTECDKRGDRFGFLQENRENVVNTRRYLLL